jgi:WD40 repeat protein
LPADGSALTEFAAALRLLRAKAGGPSYRELARRAHYSSTTLADAASGQRLPTLAVTVAYVKACGGEPGEWTDRWHAIAAGDTLAEPDDTPCPYAGLAAFQPQDADRFFGRERLTDELVERVRAGRVRAVLGASGSGKSSLLRAGLMARLRDERVLLITPGPHPLEACAAALDMPASGADELRRDPRALHRTVLRSDADLTLVVDQFEEVFSLCGDPAERDAFITSLLTAAHAPNSRLRVVVGIRADFFQRCSEHAPLFAALQDATLLVGPMAVDDLRRAVALPAAGAGCIVEGALLTRVVADAAGQPTVLPLISHAMRETWRRRRGNALTLSGYEASGGLRHALANTAEDAYSAMSPARRRIARSVFLRLVTLGEGTGDTRRRADRAEFRDPEAAAVLESLAAARLVTLDDGTVELAHEALLSAWPRLAGWIDADRDTLRTYQRLADAAAAWAREHRDAGGLLRGGRLASARHWLDEDHRGITPTDEVREFLTASLRSARRASRVRRTVVALLCALTVLASAAAVVALRLRASAVDERNRAVASRMSIQAQQLTTTDASLAVRLDLAAYRLDPTADVYTDLLTSENEPLATVLTGHRDVVYAVAYSRDGRILATGGRDDTIRLWNVADPFHPVALTGLVPAASGRVYWLDFSPDGRTLAAAGRDGTITLWNVTDPAHPVPWGPRLRGHTSYVFSVAFSPDGRHLVSAGQDRTVRLWDVTDPARAHAAGPPMTGTTEPVASAAYSPDGRTLVSLGHDRTVRLWNATDPARPRPWGPPLTGPTATVYAAAFSPDARTLATVANDHTVRLWDIHDPAHARPLGRPLAGHTDTVYAVAFSPDGKVLATAGADQTVRLWNLADPANPAPLGRPLTGHTGYVYWLAFGPDGHTLASVSQDRTVRLWHLPPTTLTGHRGPVRTVAVDSTGNLLATGGADDTVRLWHRDGRAGPVLTGHTGGVDSVAFRPGGTILASASDDHTVRLWDAAHPDAPGVPLTGNTGIVHAVAFRPDGQILATAGADRGVRLWNVADPAHPVALGGATAHDDEVYDVAFRPDGRVLASGGADDRIVLRDVADPARPRVLARLTANTGGVRSLAISPSGRTLATAGADHTVRLWNITDPARPVASSVPLTGHTSFVLGVTFSPDGRTLASGGQDQSVRLWNVTDPARPSPIGHAITSHVGRVGAVAFTPDGAALVTAGDDGTAQMTPLAAAAAVAHACASTRGALTADSWHHYSPGMPYHPPCR